MRDRERIASGDVRITRRQQDNHRASIRVANLLSRLEKNANGELKNNAGEPYELSPSQVKSIQILLDRALPPLQATDLGSLDDRPRLSPEEVEKELGKLLRAMPREKIMRLVKGLPDLRIIDAEVVENG